MKAAACQYGSPSDSGWRQVVSKPVVLVKFYTKIKTQISSTKLQINLKSQYSMIKTFAKIAARHDIKFDEPGMVPLGAMANDPLFVFLNLGHWDLFEIWYLVLGIFIIRVPEFGSSVVCIGCLLLTYKNRSQSTKPIIPTFQCSIIPSRCERDLRQNESS